MRDPRFDRAYYHGIVEKPPGEEKLEKARAHARALAQSVPNSTTFDEVMEGQEELSIPVARVFYEALVDAIRASDKTRRAWISELRALIDEEVNQQQPRDWFVAYCEEWREQANPFNVWGAPFNLELRGIHYGAHSERLFFAADLLLKIDRGAWFDTLDAFPFPNFAYAALWSWSRIAEDGQLLEELLREAPPVLSPDGQWLSQRRVTALLLIPHIPTHAQLLFQAEEQLQARRVPIDENDQQLEITRGENDVLKRLMDDELPNWMRSAFRIVLDRPDGQAILIGYLAHLCDAPKMTQPPHQWYAPSCARRILAEELARAGITVEMIQTVWHRSGASTMAPGETPLKEKPQWKFSAEEGEGGRALTGEGGSFLYAAASILDVGPASELEIRALWHFLEERLLHRDIIFRDSISLFRHEAPNLFAKLFARLPAPDAWLRDLYRKLEPQRRRALFSLRYEGDRDAEETSRFLIRLGLYCCTHVESWHAANPRHELFWWLYDAARRLWLTSLSRWNDDARSFLAVCFAFLPEIFGDMLPDVLSRALAPIRNDAWLVSMAGAFLWQDGVDAVEVTRIFQKAGIHLPSALRDAHQWATISESRQRRVKPNESEFWPIARDLAAKLNVTLDNALPMPQRPSLRNEFLSTVPWGRALWEALEREEHTHIRVRSLAPQTWLIQSTAPEALRQRFGLSPDIRILAVYGQLAGRDVRLAINEPTDADAVDPDLLVIACDHPDFAKRFASRIPGPFCQRIPWIPSSSKAFPPLVDMFCEYAGKLDLFQYRDPVRGRALVGRTQEIEELTRRLLQGEAVGVFGLRKVGKSSLLQAVAEWMDPIGSRRGMFRGVKVELPDDASPMALVVSLDAQGVAARTLTVLVERLLESFDERLELAGMRFDARVIAHEDPLEQLRRRLVFTLERSSLPICFMIDEYDLLFAGYNGEGGMPGIERLFGLLRAEANASRRVSLALVGRDPAFADEPHIGGVTNPLLGWVYHQWLGPLRRDEADELLVRIGKRVGLEVGQQSLDLGWSWTGGHPLLHRQYGSALFEFAHAPGTRPRPVPTDPVCLHAIDAFPSRDAVETINREIATLLGVRFPESYALLEAMANAVRNEVGAVVARHGGKQSRAFRVLWQFGIVKTQDGDVWVPQIFRHEFGAESISEVHEVAGEE